MTDVKLLPLPELVGVDPAAPGTDHTVLCDCGANEDNRQPHHDECAAMKGEARKP